MSEGVLLLVSGTIGFLGTCGGVYVSWRMLKPNQQKVIEEAGKSREEAKAIARSTAIEEADRMLQRYADIVREQDAHLLRCENKIEEIAKREEECENRASALATRVDLLERRLRRHNIGD